MLRETSGFHIYFTIVHNTIIGTSALPGKCMYIIYIFFFFCLYYLFSIYGWCFICFFFSSSFSINLSVYIKKMLNKKNKYEIQMQIT